MRRRLIAASVLVLMVSLAGAPAVSASPRDEGGGWGRWVEAVLGLVWGGGTVDALGPMEVELLNASVCSDPWGRAEGGASCPVPPSAPVTNAPDDPGH